MSRGSNWWLILASCVCIVSLYVGYVIWFPSDEDADANPMGGSFRSYIFGASSTTTHTSHTATMQHRCVWHEGDPVLYHLKTKMGVNYDAGHWFHMAENFMVQHSILRDANELTNASNVIYSFDKGKKIYYCCC